MLVMKYDVIGAADIDKYGKWESIIYVKNSWFLLDSQPILYHIDKRLAFSIFII